MFSSTPCVIGLDVGGTSTRACVATLDGTVLGTAETGGGNPISRGIETASNNIQRAISRALGTHEPAAVQSVVIGIAGAISLQAHYGADLFNPVWAQLGLSCPIELVGDALVAFSAGTPESDGTILIAGTGAIAAAVANHALQGKRDDGYGWLLGDLGSGFWLGKKAAHHTLRVLSGVAEHSALTKAVLSKLTTHGSTHTLETLIGQLNSRPPIELAELAPLVTSAASNNDPLAMKLINTAAELLCDKVTAVRPDTGTSPIVLAGSLLQRDTPISRSVREHLSKTQPSRPVHIAGNGAAAATWLAARRIIQDTTTHQLHQRLLGTDH